MTTTKPLTNSKLKSTYQTVGLVIYIFTILLSSTLVMVEPDNFDIIQLLIPMLAVMFVSALGIGHRVASKSSSEVVTILGTIVLAILLTFVSFSIVATVAWFVALSHV